MAGETQDRRVRRTRAMLRQALTELMSEKSIREITVKELTQRADVNRGTFYSHYEDIYDMVQQLENELFEEFDSVLNAYPAPVTRDSVHSIIGDVFSFLRRNADLCTTLLGDGKDSSFLERLKAAVHQRVDTQWGELYAFPTPEARAMTLTFLVGGAVGLVQAWSDRGWKETPEELAALADRLIRNGLSGLSAPEG